MSSKLQFGSFIRPSTYVCTSLSLNAHTYIYIHRESERDREYRSDSGKRERRAVSIFDKASRRIGRMKASSTSVLELESRKPTRRRPSTRAELKSPFCRAKSAPKRREWSLFSFVSTSLLQLTSFSPGCEEDGRSGDDFSGAGSEASAVFSFPAIFSERRSWTGWCVLCFHFSRVF